MVGGHTHTGQTVSSGSILNLSRGYNFQEKNFYFAIFNVKCKFLEFAFEGGGGLIIISSFKTSIQVLASVSKISQRSSLNPVLRSLCRQSPRSIKYFILLLSQFLFFIF